MRLPGTSPPGTSGVRGDLHRSSLRFSRGDKMKVIVLILSMLLIAGGAMAKEYSEALKDTLRLMIMKHDAGFYMDLVRDKQATVDTSKRDEQELFLSCMLEAIGKRTEDTA